MATHRHEPFPDQAWDPEDNALARAQAALAEALKELSRLTQDPLFDRVDGVVADLVNAPASSRAGLDTVHKLRDLSAEHERIAIELEAAAHCCRMVEKELKQRVDTLLAVWEGQLSAMRGPGPQGQHSATRGPDPHGYHSAIREFDPPGYQSATPGPEGPSAVTRRRTSRDGWLGEMFRRGRADSRPTGERLAPVTHEPEHRPAPPPMARQTPDPEPIKARSAADIAAQALGPLEVRVAGRLVPKWTSLKARAVFQYLLVHQDRPTRRDVLMALQWPDHSHTSARNNLNVALYSLRNTLDGLGGVTQPIVYRDGCYILNPELTWWIDRNEFLSALDDARLAGRAGRPEKVMNSYHKAIQLYRGPLFEDDGAGEWYLPEQRRLKDLYGQALEQVAEIHLRLGELPEVLRFGQLGLDNDPCSEAIHRLLMRCYAAQRQQQFVNRQYQVCAGALREELGVSPSDETTQLFRELICAASSSLCAE
jgi:DNA-binding SARP family transcriptional activator